VQSALGVRVVAQKASDVEHVQVEVAAQRGTLHFEVWAGIGRPSENGTQRESLARMAAERCIQSKTGPLEASFRVAIVEHQVAAAGCKAQEEPVARLGRSRGPFVTQLAVFDVDEFVRVLLGHGLAQRSEEHTSELQSRENL